MSHTTHDPANYHNLNQPFESPEEGNKAIAAFYDDIEALRKKHKIPDLLIVIQGQSKYEDGNIGTFMNLINFGNQLNQVPMAAYAYGRTQADHREMVNKLLAGN